MKDKGAYIYLNGNFVYKPRRLSDRTEPYVNKTSTEDLVDLRNATWKPAKTIQVDLWETPHHQNKTAKQSQIVAHLNSSSESFQETYAIKSDS